MARMLTTDIFLTQFIAWSIYFFWKSWRSLDALPNSDDNTRKASAGKSMPGNSRLGSPWPGLFGERPRRFGHTLAALAD